MADATAVAPPPFGKLAGSAYARNAAADALRSSRDFEDVIGRLERLGFGRDRESAKFAGDATDPNHDDDDDDEGAGCEEDGGNDEQEDLVERGPMKSQFRSSSREQPYRTRNDGHARSLKPDDTDAFPFDYDETAKQLFQNKEYSEKLNACLDQLQEPSNCCSDGGVEGASIDETFQFAFAPATIAAVPNEDSLLERISRGALEAAQCLSEHDFLRVTETVETDARDRSSGIAVIDASRGTSDEWAPPTNLPSGPGRSLRVTASTYRPFQSSFVSSASTSASASCPSDSSPTHSSSSNRSYGNTPSPDSYRIPFDSLIGDHLGKYLQDFAFWNDACGDGAPDTGELVRSDRGNVVDIALSDDIVGHIDNTDLQLVEEVLRDLDGEKSESENVAGAPLSFIDPETCQKSLGNDSAGERCSTRCAPETSPTRVRTTRSEVLTGNSAAGSFSRSNGFYAGCANIPDNELTDIGLTRTVGLGYANISFPPNCSAGRKNAVNGIAERSRTDKDATGAGEFDRPSVTTLLRSSPSSSSFTSSPAPSPSPSPASSTYASPSSSPPCFATPSAANAGVSIAVDPESKAVFEPRYRYSDLDEFPFAGRGISKDDSQIPKIVANFESRPRERRNSDRNIMPWPWLNLPSVEASERLKEGLNPRDVERAMSDLLKRSVEELARQDEDGDTMLMCLVGNTEELTKKRAYLVPLVERLSTLRGALSVTNDRGEDALCLAALNNPRFSYVTGYLAAAMLRKGIDVSQRLYHIRGDTLIHSVAAQGDSHGEILAELLALRTTDGNAVFDLSKRNYDGKTPLHVAIESHDPLTRRTAAVAVVKLLLNHGSDPSLKETKCGDTALHMAVSRGCDPALVKVLLAGRASPNDTNYNHDTPLHVAASLSTTVPLERQREVCWLLIQAGGHANVQNHQGKTPLALVSPERKDVVRKIFYKRL